MNVRRAIERRVRRRQRRALQRRIADRQRPPEPGPGWEVGLPEFVGVGAQRAGTTWWHSMLTEHPDVFGPRVKEMHFFGRKTLGRDPSELAAAYAQYFPRPPGAVAGEWTPEYLHRRHVPEQLHAVVPDARLLVLLRDPIERYRSGAIRRPLKTEDALLRGLYATQLRRYLAHYPREQILVLQYERCLAEPEAELAKTLSFIGVDSTFVPKRFDRGGARSFKSAKGVEGKLLRRLMRKYEPEVAELSELGFDIDLSLWPNFAHLAR